MRLLVAGLIGGTLLWLWGVAAHMFLPIGNMGMETAVEQDAAIAALKASATSGEGVYMIPGMAPEQWGDAGAMQAFTTKYASSPYALVIYRPDGNPGMSGMLPNMIVHWITCVIGGLIAAWLLARAASSFGRRVLIAAPLGLFEWLDVNVPYWNWYMFPDALTIGAALDQVIGWANAGLGLAWWLGRRRA